MRVIDPGHTFALDWLDGSVTTVRPSTGVPAVNTLTFVKREGERYPGNVGHYPGTNLQEVLRACISRVKYLDKQLPHEGNMEVLFHLRKAMMELELRAAERHGRYLNGDNWHNIEDEPTCPRCGHIGCLNQECEEFNGHQHLPNR